MGAARREWQGSSSRQHAHVGEREVLGQVARLIMNVLNVSDTAMRGRWPERLRPCGPVSGTSPGAAVRDRDHGLVVGTAVVCAIAALAVPVSVTVWVVEGACIISAAPFGRAGASAANDADERITVVGIAAHRICADGAEGQSARNEKSSKTRLIDGHMIFFLVALTRARAGTGDALEHNTPGASAIRCKPSCHHARHVTR